jgi:hypothetical protein
MPDERTFKPVVGAAPLAFGGPLLGDSDRRCRAAARLPAGVCRRAARASPAMRLTLRICSASSSRCTLRARVRARAQTRSRRALGRCTPRGFTAVVQRRHRAGAAVHQTSRVSSHCYQAKQATWDVSTAFRDVRNVPKRPKAAPETVPDMRPPAACLTPFEGRRNQAFDSSPTAMPVYANRAGGEQNQGTRRPVRGLVRAAWRLALVG